jgi:ATP phosphoribosyltransferase regulatory subunit
VRALRAAGRRVVNALPGALEDPRELGCTHRLVSRGGRWELEPIDVGA